MYNLNQTFCPRTFNHFKQMSNENNIIHNYPFKDNLFNYEKTIEEVSISIKQGNSYNSYQQETIPKPELRRAQDEKPIQQKKQPVLSLFKPSDEEVEQLNCSGPPEANEAALREIFNFVEPTAVYTSSTSTPLTQQELQQLTRGILN